MKRSLFVFVLWTVSGCVGAIADESTGGSAEALISPNREVNATDTGGDQVIYPNCPPVRCAPGSILGLSWAGCPICVGSETTDDAVFNPNFDLPSEQ